MLGTLAKYIFGGMLGDASETTAPELQYQTREVNDWLLVDMPDQAIDDEDIDSESDDDEILTALPLLMAEETVQPLQSYEKMKDFSVCDNSNDKAQRHCVEKIHSVPTAVQHHSGDKTQGNFVDNIEAVSVEVEDNFSSKIQDISANIQEYSDNAIQDKSDAQVSGISVELHKLHLFGEVQKSFDDRKKSIHPFFLPNPFFDTSDDKNNSDAVSVEKSSAERSCDNNLKVQINNRTEARKIDIDEMLKMEFAVLNENPGLPDNYNKCNLVDEMNEMKRKMNESQFSSDCFFQEGLKVHDFSAKSYDDDEGQKKCDVTQTNLNHTQAGFYLETYNHEPVNYNCAPRRLYSHVVQMGKQNQVSTDLFRNELGKNYDQCVRVFSDEIQESSDDDMNETSEDEKKEKPNDEMNENSDEEEENSYDEYDDDESSEKAYTSNASQISSDEESEEYLEDEPSECTDAADFQKRYHFMPNDEKVKLNQLILQQKILQDKLVKMENSISNHNIGGLPEITEALFINVCCNFHSFEQAQVTYINLCLNQEYKRRLEEEKKTRDSYAWEKEQDRLRQYFHLSDEKLATNTISLLPNSAEILQNIINQKSTNVPTKTAVVLEHIKELKPVQQAIQFDNRRHLTRSQLNRQNKNYMYQSSTKSNRRRNLQRNHSGANNNRKC